MYRKEQVDAYLKKIDCQACRECTAENLRTLHYRHLLHIPYENLDPMNGVALSLKPEALFNKMILGSRGGYCFELQGLFGTLLQTLGYQVAQYAGRFMDEPWHIQMRRHRVLVVALEGVRYVCDVGVRQESSRYPLVLEEGRVQTDGLCEYRYEKDDFYGWVLLQKQPGKDWKEALGFTEEPQTEDDYVMPSFYCEKHPESTFNKYMKISVFTEEANLNIVKNEFRVFQEGRIAVRESLETEEQVRALLRDKFGIQIPKAYQLL